MVGGGAKSRANRKVPTEYGVNELDLFSNVCAYHRCTKLGNSESTFLLRTLDWFIVYPDMADGVNGRVGNI